MPTLEGGREQIRKRLDDPATWAKIRISSKKLIQILATSKSFSEMLSR
jgi:hypothetical protein